MNWSLRISLLTLACLDFNNAVLASQHRMVRMHSRQNSPPSSTQPQTIADKIDPGMQLTEDSDADESLNFDESMRLMMRRKAESVIASHVGTSFSPDEVESILSGNAPSLHPGSLKNVSWTLDMFEMGSTLPTSSSTSSMSSSIVKLTVTSDGVSAEKNAANQADTTTGVVNVDQLLHSFFHADAVKSIFDKVLSETDQVLDKQAKKQLIKNTAPTLHKTIEKVASHRGWGIQDSRFAQMHLEGDQEGQSQQTAQTDGVDQPALEAFKDYNTFVKTLRCALITSSDAALDSAQEQEATPRTDLASKA